MSERGARAQRGIEQRWLDIHAVHRSSLRADLTGDEENPSVRDVELRDRGWPPRRSTRRDAGTISPGLRVYDVVDITDR